MEKGQAKTPKKTEKTIITYRRISKRLAVETTSLYCSCSQITSTNHSCSSLLKSKHAISITCTEMHADHIVSSGSPHNNVLHFSSNIIIIVAYYTDDLYHIGRIDPLDMVMIAYIVCACTTNYYDLGIIVIL